MQLLPELPVRFQKKETKLWIDYHLVAKEMGQPAPKQPRLEEVHMVEMTADDELYAVVESKLDAAAKQQFKEAKRKASLPWCENDAWRPVDRNICA